MRDVGITLGLLMLTWLLITGLGPLLVGPLSEVYGRSIIYRASFVFFFAFTWPVSFPPNIGERGQAFILCTCDSKFKFYVAVFLVFRGCALAADTAWSAHGGRNTHIHRPRPQY